MYVIFNNVDAHIEKDNEDKYVIFASTDKNKEACISKLHRTL